MFRSNVNLWTLFSLLLVFASSGKAADCQKPDLKGNVVLTKEAVLKNDFPDGSDITVECALGHEVDHGSNIITCVDGTWSELNLICKKKDCGPPKPAANLKYEMPDGTLFGVHIKPVCDRGYFLQGSSYRQCLAMGWVGNSRCVLITCEEPTEIPNGVIAKRPNKSYPEFGDVIEYSCDPSYILIGNQSIICHDEGEYSSPPPECKVIKCEEPTEIPNGVIVKRPNKTYPEFGDVIEYSCDPSYILIGNQSIICHDEGEYSSPPPECKDIKTTENYPETSETTTTSIRTSASTASTTLPNSSSIPPIPGTTPPNSSSIPPIPGTATPNSGVVGAVIGIGIGIGIGVLCLVLCIGYVLSRRKGSYDTGEALKMKEELLQKRTKNLI